MDAASPIDAPSPRSSATDGGAEPSSLEKPATGASGTGASGKGASGTRTRDAVEETLRHWSGSAGELESRRRRESRERALRDTGLLEDALEPELQASFDRVVEQVRELLDAPASLFTLIVEDRQIFRAGVGLALEGNSTPISESLCRHVRDADADVVIHDLRGHPLRIITPGAVENGAIAYLGTPVYADVAGEKVPVASLSAVAPEPRAWSRRDLAALRALADGISTRLSLAASLAQARHERGRAHDREVELERFFESLPQTVVVWRAGGKAEYASPHSFDLVGISPEAFLEGDWRERVHPDDRGRLSPEGIAADERRRESPYRLRDDAGRYRSVVSRTVSTVGPTGEERFITTLTDLSGVLATEEALREERERMRAIFDVLPSAFFLVGADGRVLQMNALARELLGDATGADTVTHPWPEMAYVDAEGNEIRHAPENFLSARARRGESVRESRMLRLKTPTGFRYLQGAAEPVRDADGGVTGAVVTLQDMTEIRHAQAAVEAERREGQRRIEQLVDAMPIFTGLIAPDGRMLFLNEAPLRAVGATRADVVGKVVWEAAWVEGDPEARESLREIIETAAAGTAVEREITFRWQGRVLEMQYYAVPIRDEEGRVVALSTSAVDVSERNAAKRLVEAERRQLQQVMDSTPIMIGLLDAEGRLLYANDAPLRAVGASLDDVRGLHLWETPWATVEGMAERIRDGVERARRGETATMDIHFPQPDGETLEVEHSIAPIYGADGRVEFLLPSAIDVTARNRARRLIEAEGRELRQVMEQTPVYMALSDLGGRFLYANRSLMEAVGVNLDEIRELPAWEAPWIEGWEVATNMREACEMAAAGRTSFFPIQFKGANHRTAGGDAIEVEQRVSPLRDENGRVTSLLFTGVDVTSRNRAQRIVEAEGRQLRQVMEQTPIFMGICDLEGRIAYANEAPLRAIGTSWEDVRGVRIWESPWVENAAAAERVRAACRTAARGERTVFPFRFRTADGAFLELEQSVSPLRDDLGHVASFLFSAVDVTERNRALRAAEDERGRLREILDGMTTAVKLFDAAGRLVMANPAAFRAHEAPLDDMVGRQMWELPWFADEGLQDPIQTAVARAQRGEIVHLPVHAGIRGDVHEYETSIVPIRDADGTIVYLLAESVDVTEARRSAAQIEADRRRLQQIVDTIPVGLLIYDADRRIVRSNAEAFSTIGITREQLERGEVAEGYYIEADGREIPLDLDEAPLRRALRGDDARDERTLRLHWPGDDPENDRFVTAYAAPLRNAEGEIDGAVFTVSNVKPLREAEQAIVRERLAGAERLHRMLQELPIFVSLLDVEGRLVYANQAPLRASGLTLDQLEGLLPWETPWVRRHTETQEMMKEAVRSAQGGRMFSAEAKMSSLEGTLEVDFSLIPVSDETGQLRYLLATTVDVTERNRALRELEAASLEAKDAQVSAERAKEAAERATRAKDEFLSVLSHELRTPLTPAMLGLELMAADIELIERTREADTETLESIRDTFGSVRQNLDLQVRLIDDLLDITRIARGKLELHKEPFDLHAAIQHAVEITSVDAVDKGVELAFIPGAERATVDADPARIRQILWNLLANAVKFTPRGGRVTVSSLNPTPGTLLVTVCDTGKGIAADQTELIFNAFEQGGVGVTRDFGGLGLGLAISRSLAHAHGASLVARSEGIGKGACFDLTMPVSESVREVAAEPDAPIRAAGGAPPRVLLVEDNPDTARMTAELLRRNGATVAVAHSVAEAVAHANSGETFEVLLTDLGLPDGNGIEVLLKLREICGPLPAVAMSGFGTEEDKRRTREAGFRAHLVKPITFARVREALQNALV